MREVSFATRRKIRQIALVCLALAASMGPTASAVAQTATPAPGTWVRLNVSGGKSPLVGRVVSVSDDSISIRLGDPSESDRLIQGRVPVKTRLSDVAGIDVRTAGGSHAVDGFFIGAASGAALGVLYAQTGKVTCDGVGCLAEPAVREVGTAVFGLLGVLVGGVVGGAIGSSMDTEVWTPAGKTTARLQIAPRRGGLAAQLSLSVR